MPYMYTINVYSFFLNHSLTLVALPRQLSHPLFIFYAIIEIFMHLPLSIPT